MEKEKKLLIPKSHAIRKKRKVFTFQLSPFQKTTL